MAEPKAALSRLLVEQRSNLHAIQRFLENFKKIGKSKMTLAVTKGRLQLLREKWNVCQRLDVELSSMASEDIQKVEPYFLDSEFLETEQVFLEAYDYLQEKVSSFSKLPSPIDESSIMDDSHVHEGHLSVRLPKIDLPRFSGSLREWSDYRNLFEALVHHNHALSDVQRLQYLKSSLDGEAAQLVKHVQISVENYASTWELLNDRYDNKRALINAHLNLIFGAPSVHDPSKDLKTLRDNCNEALLVLKNLNRPVDQWDDLLIYIVAQKLDKRTLTDWELSLGNNNEPPTYRQLDDYLSARIRSLEAVRMTADRALPSQSSGSTIRLKKPIGTHHATASSDAKCVCGQDHPLYLCRNFKLLSVESRKEFARRQSRCFNCLRPGHLLNACTSKFTCRFCRKRHHSLLHGERVLDNHGASTTTRTSEASSPVPAKIASEHSQEVSSASVNNTNCNRNANVSNRTVFLATALVYVTCENGSRVRARALLDQGSEASLVSEHLVQLLRARREPTSTGVCGVGETFVCTSRSRVHLQITGRLSEASTVSVSALVLPKLSSYSPCTSVDLSQWPHLQGLEFADPGKEAGRIEIILGADCFGAIMREGLRRGGADAPIAQLTVFGWVVSGYHKLPNKPKDKAETDTLVSSIHCTTQTVTVRQNDDLLAIVRRFWELEEVPRSSPMSISEQQCENHFILTHSRNSEGRYIVRLPFCDDSRPDLGESLSRARLILRKTQSSLARDSELRVGYENFMVEYESLKHMRPLSDPNVARIPQAVYLPHHPVVKKDSPSTKLRVVFNASSKTSNNKSLNEHLLVGPRLQTDLVTIITGWRRHRFVFKADLQKMFRQILIHEDDLDYQRILWCPSSSDRQVHYQLLTVTYGTASAPFLANRVLQQLASDEGARYPMAEQIVRHCFYVDDVFFGDHDKDQITFARQQLIDLMQRGGFTLHKWASNDDTLSRLCFATEGSFPISDSESVGQKVLGLHWSPKEDSFYFSCEHLNECPHTKRQILSLIARIFDPLGWIAPVVIVAKVLIQDLWLLGSDWDDPLPVEIQRSCHKFFEALPSIGEIKVPRWIQTSLQAPIELHGFADASSRAIAAVIYIRVLQDLDSPKVSLLVAKTKVAPVKTVSIPRLELCAAFLLAKLLHKISSELNFSQIPTYAWTDSSVVLAWLSKHPCNWRPFIANRVAEIHELVPRVRWRHVPSGQNPADCATRGLSPSELRSFRQWWLGPVWLSQHSTGWPITTAQSCDDIDGTLLEEKLPAMLTTHLITWEASPFHLPWAVSSWPKLVRITALVFRFIARSRASMKDNRQSLSMPEVLHKARIFWYHTLQRDAFHAEIKALSKSSRLSTSSRLLKLDPFLDDVHLLRMGGRLRHASLSYDRKYPLILPQHRITELLCQQVHIRTLHGGTQLMLSVLRQEFWILNARRLVKRIVHSCHTCVRQRASLSEQFMGDLPSSRVTPAPPFARCGVDYAGPLLVRAMTGRGHKSYKAYIALFVCLSTRAVHLELVSDYTTAGFLAALKRFVSRRGRPIEIHSDNGTNFIGADKEIRRVVTLIQQSDEVQLWGQAEGINWKFIPPGAPHFGGLWEAGVKSAKFHIKRVVGSHTLTFEEMTTLLCSIEACLNSRPLAALSDDPDDFDCLTPGHFLIGRPIIGLEERSLTDDGTPLLTRWHLVSQMQQHFWKRWRDEYLHSLQQRPKWNKRTSEIKEGSLVLIRNPVAPPTRWSLGRVIETHHGADGLIRVVRLRTARGIVTRPVTQLCLLPSDTSPNP